MTMSLISTITVGSNNPTTIDFTNIPPIYSDLYIMVSARFNTGSSDLKMSLNGSTTGFVSKYMYGTGAGSAASASTTTNYIGKTCSTGDTANQFGSTEIYISNYTSAYNKNINSKSVEETNATGGVQTIFATTWTSSSAITSISFYDYGGAAAFVQNTVISLYGINRTQGVGKPKATGGVISYANNRWFHTFTGSGTFSPLENLTTDYLVVAGGGASAKNVGRYGGGGGAGGYLVANGVPVTKQAYTVIVGAGGTGALGPGYGGNGDNSTFLQTTAIGGGAGGAGDDTVNRNGRPGGSGGGGTSVNGSGGAGTSGQGYAGGNTGTQSASGGGGAGGAGSNETSSAGGAGGPGLMWIDGNYYAGGGAGGGNTTGLGGIGGGGNGSAQTSNTTGTSGTANTGGGAGGAYPNQATIGNQNGNNGGSGVVVISYPAN